MVNYIINTFTNLKVIVQNFEKGSDVLGRSCSHSTMFRRVGV